MGVQVLKSTEELYGFMADSTAVLVLPVEATDTSDPTKKQVDQFRQPSEYLLM